MSAPGCPPSIRWRRELRRTSQPGRTWASSRGRARISVGARRCLSRGFRPIPLRLAGRARCGRRVPGAVDRMSGKGAGTRVVPPDSAKKLARKGKGGSDKGGSQAAVNLRIVPNELVAEIDGALSAAEADELARRHGLERIASQNFPLIGGTIGLFRIVDRRPVDTVRRELAADGSVRSVQLNLRSLPAAGEEARDRGRRRAICRHPAAAAAGARARPRHERDDRGDRFRASTPNIPNSPIRSPTVLMRSAAAKVRMPMAPGSPARSWRMPG